MTHTCTCHDAEQTLNKTTNLHQRNRPTNTGDCFLCNCLRSDALVSDDTQGGVTVPGATPGELQASQHEAPCTCGTCEAIRADRERRATADRVADEFGNAERDIRMVAVAAHARGDYEAERLALDRLALMERAAEAMSPRHSPGDMRGATW